MKNIPTEEKTEVFCIDERFYFGVEQYSEDFSEEEIGSRTQKLQHTPIF